MTKKIKKLTKSTKLDQLWSLFQDQKWIREILTSVSLPTSFRLNLLRDSQLHFDYLTGFPEQGFLSAFWLHVIK